jgi:hypothetical protein
MTEPEDRGIFTSIRARDHQPNPVPGKKTTCIIDQRDGIADDLTRSHRHHFT